MTKCHKCKTKIIKQLWIVDTEVYCSPFCERSSWDNKARRWTTKFHPHGDARLDKFGLAGLKRKQ